MYVGAATEDDTTPDSGPLPDSELIERSWDEPEVFEEIFNRHHEVVYRHVIRRVGPDAAADIASEVFVRAFAARRRYNLSYSSARPWLFGITANLLRQHYRSHRRATKAHWRVMAAESLTEGDSTGEADRRVDAEALASGLETGLAKLRATEREVLLLYAWADLSYAEIASALGIPVGTVRSRLARARQRFRELARDEWRTED